MFSCKFYEISKETFSTTPSPPLSPLLIEWSMRNIFRVKSENQPALICSELNSC